MVKKPTLSIPEGKPVGVDPLSGCAGYDGFVEELDRRLTSKKKKTGTPIAIALTDIDWFGQLNDSAGREVGNAAIGALGRFLAESAPDATVYRYGGDAFMLLFIEKEKEAVFLQAETLRNQYAKQQRNISGSQGHAPLTISMGVAACPDDATDAHTLIRKCHEALYRAKVSGRDKVCLAREEKMVTKTSHYTQGQLEGLSRLAKREGLNEAVMLREALDDLLRKYNA